MPPTTLNSEEPLIHLIDPNPRRLRTHICAVLGMRVGGFA